jgi:pimeloyl-ACP methyl ester carboxylesterase
VRVAHPRRRRVALVLVAVTLGVLLGVGVDIVRVGGPEAWLARRTASAPVAVLPPPYEARGRVVEVEGRDVYLDCRGAGSPTVILEAGFGAGAASWGAALDGIAGFTRTCAWDRPGIGRSEDRGRHSPGETAQLLRATLRDAGEAGPFVVVAHSFGGVYARLFAEPSPSNGGPGAGPDAVVALVMLDTYEPDLGLATDPSLDADVRATIQASLDSTAAMLANGENLDWAATLEELAAAGTVELPAVILTVDPHLRYTDPDPTRVTAVIEAWYRALAARYPSGQVEIVPETGHMIHLERPSLVIERTREVVNRYRSP